MPINKLSAYTNRIMFLNRATLEELDIEHSELCKRLENTKWYQPIDVAVIEDIINVRNRIYIMCNTPKNFKND